MKGAFMRNYLDYPSVFKMEKHAQFILYRIQKMPSFDRISTGLEQKDFQMNSGEKMKVKIAEGDGFVLKLIEN
ncbi:hypothetical protein D0X99_04950 [Algoriphagus lacus]|uniref:Uncharacterized protein n=1 Tax=Algoriphagus lacus TaxID=2056311 RepID=A0A418PU64_9BACT|nr:hypothetical protein D0X99_04950 [Algoriphagus lacus]